MFTKIHSLCLNTRQDDGVTQGWYEKALTPMLKWMCVFLPEIPMRGLLISLKDSGRLRQLAFLTLSPRDVTKILSLLHGQQL